LTDYPHCHAIIGGRGCALTYDVISIHSTGAVVVVMVTVVIVDL